MTSHESEYPVSAVRLFVLLQEWKERTSVLVDTRARLAEINEDSAVVMAMDVGLLHLKTIASELEQLLWDSIPRGGAESN